MPLTERAQRRTLDSLLYTESGLGMVPVLNGVSILGVERGVSLEWLPDDEREPVRATRTRRVSRVREAEQSEQVSDFQRRAAIRRSLATVFHYSSDLIDPELRDEVAVLRLEVMRIGSRAVHNGNLATVRTLLKTHPISHVERMSPEELKAVLDAIVERDQSTIENVVSQASTRRR